MRIVRIDCSIAIPETWSEFVACLLRRGWRLHDCLCGNCVWTGKAFIRRRKEVMP